MIPIRRHKFKSDVAHLQLAVSGAQEAARQSLPVELYNEQGRSAIHPGIIDERHLAAPAQTVVSHPPRSSFAGTARRRIDGGVSVAASLLETVAAAGRVGRV